MDVDKKDIPEQVAPGSSARRAYRTPALLTFGKVAALTCNSTCVGANDSTTVGVCTPGARAMASDRHVKENITCIGSHPLGVRVYLFDYKPEFRNTWGHGRQFGVMADEVESVLPNAVCMHPDGYKLVNYSMLGITKVCPPKDRH